MPTALVIFPGTGFEEIEALTPIDVLARCGVKMTTASPYEDAEDNAEVHVEGAHNVEMVVENLTKHMKTTFDAVILPGGMPGAEMLGRDPLVEELVMAHHKAGKLVCGICAAPGMALAKWGVLDGKTATCYPGFEKHFPKTVHHVNEPAVMDGNVITARGPGAAFQFAHKIAQQLVGEKKANEVGKGMLFQ
ncbi:DJ-1 [Carpediemonas membranifera]|uniref:DJ-1 n=1 Tax=Carpediemonas membranifera TaxID=201153 RepID=A0A8J6ARM1_9EUKA|nr:DJ-1 [Carpediemonas membranifera]|eukprot:KAG9390470.1 DJ-1 [Carpediemonas membranifera]